MITKTPPQDLLEKWNEEATQKWKEIRKSKGHFLSKHSPQWTMKIDLHNREETRQDLMAWTIEWFKAQGFSITCLPDPSNTDGFEIQTP